MQARTRRTIAPTPGIRIFDHSLADKSGSSATLRHYLGSEHMGLPSPGAPPNVCFTVLPRVQSVNRGARAMMNGFMKRCLRSCSRTLALIRHSRRQSRSPLGGRPVNTALRSIGLYRRYSPKCPLRQTARFAHSLSLLTLQTQLILSVTTRRRTRNAYRQRSRQSLSLSVMLHGVRRMDPVHLNLHRYPQ